MIQKGADSKIILYKRVALFFFLVVFLNLVSLFMYVHGYLHPLVMLITKATTLLIHMSGLEARTAGNIIYLTNSVWQVSMECTAIMPMLVFTSFLIAYPASLVARIIGFFTGIPLIFLANEARLLMMAVLDKLKPAYSTYFHDYMWQVAFIVMVVFMWIVWIDKVVNRETKAAVSH
jgi:exosortase/archaeosortase family protein